MFGISVFKTFGKILVVCLMLFCVSGCERLNGLDYNELAVKDPDIVKAFAEAKKNDKPVLIMLDAKWCPSCRRMNKETLVDPDVKKSLRGFEFLQIDVDENPDDTDTFSGGPASADESVVPTMIIFSPRGWEQVRVIGFKKPAVFKEILEDFL